MTEEAKKFQIKAKAALFGYQETHCLNRIKELDVFHNVIRWAYCDEKNTHCHIYVEFAKQVDHDSSNWWLKKEDGDDLKCHVVPNTATGSGFRVACDRGMFYVSCAFKEDKGDVFQNYTPGLDYLVRTNWVQTLWQQAKILDVDVRDCAAHYKCLTKSFEDSINVILKWNREQQVSVVRVKRQKFVEATLKKSHTPKATAFKEWDKQFSEPRLRYDFLWMWSQNSKTGKSVFIEQTYNTFTHVDKINWKGYDPLVHDCILFDDVKGIENYIYENKILFQGKAANFTIGASATNVHAEIIYCAEKRLVVCCNHQFKETTKSGYASWIQQNCYVVNQETQLYDNVDVTADASTYSSMLGTVPP